MANFGQTGNSVPAPSFVQIGSTVDDELLWSAHNYQQAGVTLKPGQGILLLGTGLMQDSASKMYIKADTAGHVTCLLRKTTDTGTDSSSAAQVWQANVLNTGFAKLSAVSTANSGMTLTSILGGRVDTVQGFFKF